jgi:hypothetical protein
MEPLKPETRQQILRDRPQASPADIDEYERLLAERFTADPDLPRSPAAARAANANEQRLGQLYQLLFGSPGGPGAHPPLPATPKRRPASSRSRKAVPKRMKRRPDK